MTWIVLLAICIFLSTAATIFLKMGAASLSGNPDLSSILYNYVIWIGAVLYFSAFVTYIYVLRDGALSLAQPILTSGVSVLTALLAVLIFKEQMLLLNWLGLVFICTGIFLLSVGRV